MLHSGPYELAHYLQLEISIICYWKFFFRYKYFIEICFMDKYQASIGHVMAWHSTGVKRQICNRRHTLIGTKW